MVVTRKYSDGPRLMQRGVDELDAMQVEVVCRSLTIGPERSLLTFRLKSVWMETFTMYREARRSAAEGRPVAPTWSDAYAM